MQYLIICVCSYRKYILYVQVKNKPCDGDNRPCIYSLLNGLSAVVANNIF